MKRHLQIRCAIWKTVVFVLATITSTQAQVFTLDSVLRVIDRQNPMLAEYDNKVRALNTYATGATSWMPPMVGAGTFMRPYPGQEVMHENEKGSWMFSFEQDIPNPGKLRANKNYQLSRSAVEQQNRNIKFNQLRTEAKTFYYSWLVAEEQKQILQENQRIIELMLKLARIRYQYNQGSLGSIYKAEGRLGEVQNMLFMTQGTIDESVQRLKALMALSPDIRIMIDTNTQVQFEQLSIANDTAALVQQRSDVKQIDKQIDVMRLSQALQQAQAKPEFKLRFDHMQPIGDMPKQFTAMAMVSIPIAPWSSKMYRAEVKGMQYEIEGMKRGREAILIEARGMLAGMSAKLRSMKQQLDNYQQKIIPALRKNYQTLMLAYEENREQLPIVIDAWEALNMAQMDYIEKRSEYLTMIVSYEKELEK
jgi:outer membrane protein, heavy metal efflux system